MLIEKLFIKRQSEVRIRILSHLLFWTVLFLSSFVLVKTSFDPYRNTPLSYLTPLRQTLGLALFFYPLMYLIIPFALRKKWGLFILSICLLTLFYLFIDAVGEKMTYQYCESCLIEVKARNMNYITVVQKGIIDNMLFRASNIGFFVTLFSGLLLPIAIKYAIDYYQAERDKVQLELNFLKAQVNPHFLFNTLNNLYGLILHKRIDQSAETVNRLSDFMRYSLDNAHKQTIAISEEIKLIENYVELEKLRLNHTQVDFEVQTDIEDQHLPPLLFIPLVENAFKYNVDKPDTRIEIALRIDRDSLAFTIENTFDETRSASEQGGLGLSNLQKRLDIYFPDRYTYQVQMDGGIYSARLILELL